MLGHATRTTALQLREIVAADSRGFGEFRLRLAELISAISNRCPKVLGRSNLVLHSEPLCAHTV